MPTPVCPKCRRAIPPEDVNVGNDIAYCRSCNLSNRLSELTFDSEIGGDMDVNRPVAGTWYRSDGLGMVVGASNRNLATAAAMLFFTLFWNGIVSVFVLVATSGTLHHFGIPVPSWFPAPKMNGEVMNSGMLIFLWLFLTPFITIGIVTALTVFNCLFGRTEVRVNGTQGTAFTGIGPLGWRKRFDPTQVRKVAIRESTNNKGQNTSCIVIEARDGKQTKIASMLSDERRKFLLVALRKALLR